jgi:hypothetical protein
MESIIYEPLFVMVLRKMIDPLLPGCQLPIGLTSGRGLFFFFFSLYINYPLVWQQRVLPF